MPEYTDGYQGFYHLTTIKGNVECVQMHYTIRDFEKAQFEARMQKIIDIAHLVGKGLHRDCYIEVTLDDHYYNMRDKVAQHPHIIALAQLSFRGLPCPNIFTGGYNFHGKHEFVTLEGMEKAVSVIMRIAELTAKEL